MKKKLKNLKEFEQAIKAIREEMDARGETKLNFYKGDAYYNVVASAFSFWKTGWFLIMAKYAIDMETVPNNGYKVVVMEDM